jgi:hypothetical protein
MKLYDFLTATLPASGSNYYAATKNPNSGQMSQRKFPTPTDLEAYIQSQGTVADTYFGTGTFGKSRKQEEVEQKKCFYLDIDIGPEPEKYDSKKEAVYELLQFCGAHFLQPSILVDSGNGIHAYWVLDLPVNRDQWNVVAVSLKSLSLTHGLKADAAVTADSARILRAPDTFNRKNGKLAQVKILHPDDVSNLKTYAYDELRKAATSVAGPALSVIAGLAPGDPTVAAYGYEQKAYYGKHLTNNCPMFKDAYETGGAGLIEPLWNQQLHVLSFLEDGEHWVHPISNKHKGYSKREAEAKFRQKLIAKQAFGPTKCDTFEANGAKQCATCIHRQEISTPLQLADKEYSTFPRGYEQDASGVFKWTKSSDDWVKDPVTKFQVFDAQRLWGGIGHGQIIVFDATENNKTVKVAIDYAKLQYEVADVVDPLVEAGLSFTNKEVNQFRDFMNAWTSKIRKAQTGSLGFCTFNLGWANEHKVFGLGKKDLHSDGTETPNRHKDQTVAVAYSANGDGSVWKQGVKAVTSDNNHAFNTVILTAFAAPLTNFLGDKSAVICAMSDGSGTGKTTSMQIAASVWGDPDKAMHKLDDTPNSILNKLGYINNLPGYWDEVRTSTTPSNDIWNMIMQIVQGVERSRMNQTGGQQRAGTWNTMFVIGSNESIASHASMYQADSEASRVRLFEIEFPNRAGFPDRTDLLEALKSNIEDNYGVVGETYARLLVQNFEKIKLRLFAKRDEVRKELGNEPSTRFWISTVTALLTAVDITNRWGITNIDKAAYKEWLYEEFNRQKEEVKQEHGDPKKRSERILKQFLSEHSPQIVVYNRFPNRGTAKYEILQEPIASKPCVAALAEDTGQVRISKAALEEWVQESSSASSVPNLIKPVGANKITVILNTSRHSDKKRIDVYEFKLKR